MKIKLRDSLVAVAEAEVVNSMQLLRNLGVRTIVATGVSLNVGVAGLVMVGVDLGYDVVVVTDAVAGIPREYGEAVLEHTIAPLATRVTADDVVATWARLQRP